MAGQYPHGTIMTTWLMLTLSLCVVGFGPGPKDETQGKIPHLSYIPALSTLILWQLAVRLEIHLPKDPTLLPANLSISFHTLERDGNFSMLFWWCDPGPALPDFRVTIPCDRASICRHELPHQYMAGNCTTRLQVWHDREPTWDWGMDEHSIFVKAHLSEIELQAPLYVATNESASLTVGVLPGAALTGLVRYNYSFEHLLHATAMSSVNHTFRTAGLEVIRVLATNDVSNLTALHTISVQDRIQGLNISEIANRTDTDVTVTFTCTLAQGSNVTYVWDFDDGSQGNTTLPSIQHHFKDPGLYNVTLVAVNNINQLNETFAVQVDPTPPKHAARDAEITVPIVLTLLGTVVMIMVVR